MNSGYLIDTCGVIWLTQKLPVAQEASSLFAGPIITKSPYT